MAFRKFKHKEEKKNDFLLICYEITDVNTLMCIIVVFLTSKIYQKRKEMHSRFILNLLELFHLA